MSSRISVEDHWRFEHYLQSLCRVVIHTVGNGTKCTKIVSWSFPMILFVWSTVWYSLLILKMSWCPSTSVLNSWSCRLWIQFLSSTLSSTLSDFDTLMVTVSLSGCSKNETFTKFIERKVHFSQTYCGEMSNPSCVVSPSSRPWNFKRLSMDIFLSSGAKPRRDDGYTVTLRPTTWPHWRFWESETLSTTIFYFEQQIKR